MLNVCSVFLRPGPKTFNACKPEVLHPGCTLESCGGPLKIPIAHQLLSMTWVPCALFPGKESWKNSQSSWEIAETTSLPGNQISTHSSKPSATVPTQPALTWSDLCSCPQLIWLVQTQCCLHRLTCWHLSRLCVLHPGLARELTAHGKEPQLYPRVTPAPPPWKLWLLNGCFCSQQITFLPCARPLLSPGITGEGSLTKKWDLVFCAQRTKAWQISATGCGDSGG